MVNGNITAGGCITVTGDVHLILADRCTLTAGSGVQVSPGNTLTVYAQSTGPDAMGKLIAHGDSYSAGIGGGDGAGGSREGGAGTITINGGIVTANGSGEGAGIGGGSYGSGGTTTINGGIVTATGSGYASGIGGGSNGNGGVITINGGTVGATGGSKGAGIGGGDEGAGETITVTGGTVTANGGDEGAGIGGGRFRGGGTITINGGTVRANGRTGAAGIGKGNQHSDNGSFSTGTNSSAVIVASSIGDTSNQTNWSGIIYENGSENDGQVYGNPTITSTQSVTLPEGKTLTIPEGKRLTNQGTISGGDTGSTIGGSGILINSGTLTNITVNSSVDYYPKAEVSVSISSGTGQYVFGSNSKVTLTATVSKRSTPEDTGAPLTNGTVTFYRQPTAGGEKKDISEAISLDSQGKVTKEIILTESDWGAGNYNILAEYSGTSELKSATDTTSLTVTPATLAAPTNPVWDGTTPGKATWNAVTNASGYSVQLYKGTERVGDPVNTTTETNFTFTISDAGSYTFEVKATGSGNYMDSAVAESGKLHTVFFDTNEGGAISMQLVADAGKVTEPADPVKTGYTFHGWYSDGSFAGSEWDFENNTVTSAMTLYAKWEINTYNVTLPENQTGYTLVANPMKVNHGDDVELTFTLKEGYTADGTTGFVVKANGTALNPTAIGDNYTISNVQKNQIVTVEGVADITAPDAKITVAENQWISFLNTITFGKFFKETQTVKIEAEDKGSGPDKIYYYLADAGMTLAEVEALGDSEWTEYADEFNIVPDNKYVIYVKATDKVGNTSYISSNGLVLDATAPEISEIEDGKTYYGDTTFQAADTYLDTVKVDDNKVTLNEGAYTIPADNMQHKVTVTDKAGNVTEYTITVYKIYNVTIPRPENQTGYELKADKTAVNHGGDVNLTFTLKEGYTADGTTGFAVKANGTALSLSGGNYTISNVQENQIVTVEGVKDITAPDAEITVAENQWIRFLDTITFGKFFKETQTVKIEAEDKGSGLDKVYYHLADVGMTLAEVEALGDSEWMEYTDEFNIVPDNKYVIYVKATDKDNNIGYISSDGLVLDATAPVITEIEDGKKYYGDTTFQAADAYLDTVKVDDSEVTLNEEGAYTISADNKEHTVTVTDKAGNVTAYTITVYKIYNVTLPIPGEQTGYTLTANKTAVNYGDDVKLTFTLKEGYTANDVTGFAVKANGTALNPTETGGNYMISNVQADQIVTVEGVKDITAPDAKITVAENHWNSFLNTITFGKFFKETQTVKIEAEDKGSGLDKFYYHLADAGMILAEVKALDDTAWTEYTDEFNIVPDNKYVIYVKATDKDNNIGYISSDGLVLDATAPEISEIQDGETYYGDKMFKVADTYLDTVKVDGSDVVLSEGAYTIQADNMQHTVSVADKAGNVTEYTITVYKIYSVTLPETQTGYTLTADKTAVNYGDDVTFTYELGAGYTEESGFAVKINGQPVVFGNGTYTVENVSEDISLTVEGVADITAPTAEVKVGTDRWNSFLNAITFGKFFKETQTVEIIAEDSGGGVDKVSYHLANAGMTLDQVKALKDNEWTEYTDEFSINPDNEYVIYVKAADKDKNTAYISSDGLVLDATAPEITEIEDGKTYYGDTTFQAADTYLDTVKVDDGEVTLTEGAYTISADNMQHKVTVTDKAGNVTEYTITVYKNYTVTYVADGKTVSTQQIGYGKDAAEPEIPAKSGYTKTAPHWDKDGKNITEDIIITAVYTKDGDVKPTDPTKPAKHIDSKNQPAQTGDTGSLWFWVLLLIVFGSMTLGTYGCIRKRKEK